MEKFYDLLRQLSVGDRIIVPKSVLNLVQHHAVYLGEENGTHYLIENKEGFGVRVLSAHDFFKEVSCITRIEAFTPSYHYSRQDLVEFALSKVGLKYNLTKYNCEHLANEIQYRNSHSEQVKKAEGFTMLAATVLIAVGLLGGFK